MTTGNYGEQGLDLIRRYLGESALAEVCQHYGLDESDSELLMELISRWNPDATTQEHVALATEFADRPNLGKVMRALSLLARETAQESAYRGRPKTN